MGSLVVLVDQAGKEAKEGIQASGLPQDLLRTISHSISNI